CAARENCPRYVRNPAADQRFVLRRTLTNCKLHLSLREIETLFSHHEFRSHLGIACVEFVKHARPHQAVRSRGWARDANRSDMAGIARSEMSLETQCRGFNAFGVGTHLLTKLGKLVAGWTPAEETTSEISLKRREPPVYSGLAQAERLRRRQCASVARDGQEVANVVPIKHALSYAILGSSRAILRLRCGGLLAYAFLVSLTALSEKARDEISSPSISASGSGCRRSSCARTARMVAIVSRTAGTHHRWLFGGWAD